MNQEEFSTQSDLGYGQLFAIFWRRRYWFASVFFGVLAVAVPLALLKDPIYRSTLQLLVEPNYRDREAGIENEFTDSGVEIDYATQLQLMRSSALMQKAVNQLSIRYPNLDVDQISRSLQLAQLGNDQPTKIFEVSYSGENPKKTQDVLQAMQEVYIEYNLEQQEQRLSQGLSFINRQLPETREELASAEEELKQFRTSYNAIVPDQEASELAEALQSLKLEQETLQGQIQETQARYQELQQQLDQSPQNALISARLSESSRYQTLLNQLQETEVEIATQSSRFTEASPIVQNLLEQRSELRQLLRQQVEQVLGRIPPQLNLSEIALEKQGQLGSTDLSLARSLVETQTQLESLQARERSLAETEAELRADLQEFPNLIAEYNRLQQEVEVKRDSLDQLLVARQELGVELARGGFKWQVVEPPRLGYQVGPNTQQDLLLGGVVAIFLGGVVAFVREAIDDALRSADQIQEEALTLLGTTPKLPEPNLSRFRINLPWEEERDSPILEILQWLPFRDALDLIYKNIELVSSGSTLRSLAVTSALSGEGKSTLALGLALSAARCYRRVLLIDADLRQPSLHEELNLPNTSGLATILAGETKPLPHQVTVMGSEIDVLTAGPISADPVPLLSSGRLQELKEALGDYDLIIFDTPPVLGVVDTLQVASVCSSTLLVARLDYLTQTELRQVSAQLSKLNIIGIVANGAREIPNRYFASAESNHHSDDDSKKVSQPLLGKQSGLRQSQELEERPLAQLAVELNARQNSLEQVVAFIQDQEKELEEQLERIHELEERLQQAQASFKEDLRIQLAEEKDRYRFLEKSLVGQRQNLQSREDLIQQYQEVLRHRRTELDRH